MSVDCFYESEHWNDYVNSIISLGNLCKINYDLKETLLYYKYAESQAKQYLLPNNKLNFYINLNIGFYYSYLGEYKNSLLYFNRTVELIKTIEIPNYEKATVYNNYGVLLRKTGDFQASIKAIEFAYDLINQENRYLTKKGIYQFALARTFKCLYDYKNSEICLKKSIYFHNQTNSIDNSYKAYIELMKLYVENTDIKKYNTILPKLELLYQNVSDNVKYQYYEVKGDYYSKFNSAKSIDYYLTAINNLESLNAFDYKIDLFNIHYKLSLIYFKNGNFQFAISTINKALEIISYNIEKMQFSPSNNFKIDIIKALFLKYKIKLVSKTKNNQILFSHIQEVISSLEKDNFSLEARLFWSLDYNEIFQFGLRNAYALNEKDNFIKLLESNKSKSVLVQLNKNIDLLSSDVPASLIKKESELTNLISYYENKDGNLLTIKQNLLSAKIEYGSFLKDLEDNYPQYFSLKYANEELELINIQKSLPKFESIIEYYVADSSLYSILIQHDTVIINRKENIEYIKHEILSYIETIRQPNNTLSFQGHVNILTDYLLGDFLSLIEENTQITIIPDGFLLAFPFETLKNKSGDFLIDNYNISYEYSIALSQLLKIKSKANAKLFTGYAYSSPKHNLGNNRNCNQEILTDLLCSTNELNSIRNNLDISQKVSFSNKSEFIDHLKKSKIIHLSTHACADVQDIRSSKIYLQDEFLTFSEISSMKINADLIVLSACETGAGLVSKGDGVMSIAKSFFFAGIKSTVTSLWPVDDCSTSEIMSKFYKNLKKGHTKSQALRIAKLNYIKSAHPERRSPYYWAGFIVVGNNDNLFNQNFHFHILFAVVFAISLIILLGHNYILNRKDK